MAARLDVYRPASGNWLVSEDGEPEIPKIRCVHARPSLAPIAPRSPWQNGHAERLIGSLRRECLDHVIVFGERQLRQLLFLYKDYYNRARTHLP
jgi:Integrase core domain